MISCRQYDAMTTLVEYDQREGCNALPYGIDYLDLMPSVSVCGPSEPRAISDRVVDPDIRLQVLN